MRKLSRNKDATPQEQKKYMKALCREMKLDLEFFRRGVDPAQQLDPLPMPQADIDAWFKERAREKRRKRR